MEWQLDLLGSVVFFYLVKLLIYPAVLAAAAKALKLGLCSSPSQTLWVSVCSILSCLFISGRDGKREKYVICDASLGSRRSPVSVGTV